MTENFDPQVICQCSGISVVHAPETGENSLKKRANSLCLFIAISRYSAYMMTFTKVTRPCYCLGSLETSSSQLSGLLFFFLTHGRQRGSNNPVKTEKKKNILKLLRYKYMFCLQVLQFRRYFKPFFGNSGMVLKSVRPLRIMGNIFFCRRNP